MLILILVDIQYLQNVIFSLEKVSGSHLLNRTVFLQQNFAFNICRFIMLSKEQHISCGTSTKKQGNKKSGGQILKKGGRQNKGVFIK